MLINDMYECEFLFCVKWEDWDKNFFLFNLWEIMLDDKCIIELFEEKMCF